MPTMLQDLVIIAVAIFLLSYVSLAVGHGWSSDRSIIESTQTEDGDLFDCIDINQQPTLGHPLLKNHEIQMEPSSYPSGLHISSEQPATNALPSLPTVACPVGTVPILRESIPILQEIQGHIMNLSSSLSVADGGKGALAGAKTVGDIYGTRVTINVFEPKVIGKTGDFSASWTLMINDQNAGYIESIGAGSMVWPSFLGDNFARFHITWRDSTRKCYDHLCPGFVQVSQSIGLGGRIRPVSIYNGHQYAINVTLFKDPKTKDWWLAYGEKNTPIGYWPSSIFTSMRDKASAIFWGGHLRGPTIQSNMPEMGSGHFASEGYGRAAHMKHIQIVDEHNNLVTPDSAKSASDSTIRDCFTVEEYGFNDDGMHFYYGGPGGSGCKI